MAKKSSNSGSGSGNKKNWSKVKSGGGAFKDVSVPVNTKSRRVPTGCGY